MTTNSIIEINATTGEHSVRQMTSDEMIERQEMAHIEQQLAETIQAKHIAFIHEQILLKTLQQVFTHYLQEYLSGNLPVVTFADFMGQVFQGYLANGGQISATPPPENNLQQEEKI